jgi:DGQHR domain-containing protein
MAGVRHFNWDRLSDDSRQRTQGAAGPANGAHATTVLQVSRLGPLRWPVLNKNVRPPQHSPRLLCVYSSSRHLLRCVTFSCMKIRRLAKSYPALLLTQNQHRFYFFTIPVDDLFPFCFVARRDEDPLEGFQRVLSSSRAADIATYLASGSGSIPSNIVLSAQSEAHLRYERKTKSISFRRVQGAFLVLDGQHRLWGYHLCSVRHRVPVAVYEELGRPEETKLFIDINTTQRGVPAALLLDIKHLADVESAQENILRELFDRLNADPRSPLAGKLSATKSLSGRISRVTFNRALAPVVSSGLYAQTEPEARYGLLLNYLRALEAELSDKKLLMKAAFFEAAFSLFEEVVRTTLTGGGAKVDALRQTVQPFARLNYHGTSGRALQNKKDIVALMHAAVRQRVSISGDML